MKNLKNIFLYLLLSIISIPTFSQVVPNYVDTIGLVSWYEFNGNLKDHKGDSLNKTGNVGFFGDTVYLNGAKISRIINTTNVSISTWIKSSDLSFSENIYDILMVNNQSVISSRYKNGKSEFFLIDKGDDGEMYINKKDWVNLTLTISDSSKVYINGTRVKVFEKPTNITSISIGGTNKSLISIDNLGIWNRELDTNEIKNLYNKSISTGISDTKLNPNSLISVYPNPASDYIVIDNNDYQNKLSVLVHNSLGQIVFNSNINESKFKINVDDLGTNGMYFVNIIKYGNIIDTKKIIVQK